MLHVRTLVLALLVVLTACAPMSTATTEAQTTPTGVIMLIADGAGAAHWTLASFANDSLAVHSMKSVGLVDTRGADHTVSGSAPTATAYATGVRSYMGAIGVDIDGNPVESVLEVAQARGWSTGLMTTTFISDATPAAFGAHAPQRADLPGISKQLVTKGIDVLLGGGRAAFGPDAQPDGVDLLETASSDYTYVETIDELRQLDLSRVDNLLGLFAEGDMGIVQDRGVGAFEAMASAALEIVSGDPDGFFLMIENEESDTQSHQNADEAVITQEMLDFDRAVGLALDFQREHPGTLVVVTGDHETAGISLTHDREREVVMRYASGNHTGTLIPLFAAGPGAERLTGIIRNDRVGQVLKELVRGPTD